MPVGDIFLGFSRASGVLVGVAWAGAAIVGSAGPLHAQAPPPRVEKRPLGQGLSVYLPGVEAVERRDARIVVNPTGAVSLQEALALALLHNPALAAFAWESRALEARLLQPGRLPNPTLELLAEDFWAGRMPGSDADQPVQPQATIQLSQLIELGGKRTARQQVAALDRDLAAWDYETARIDVFSDVSRGSPQCWRRRKPSPCPSRRFAC